jgi:putative peptidoglycan lipid II flippase
MPKDFFKKGLGLLLRRQNNILSAAFVIMATIIFSQVLGLIRQRLLVAIFGASNTLGVYLVSTRLPDFLFQLLIAGALSSAFIPVFSDYLVKGKEKEGHKVASTLLMFSLVAFMLLALVLFIFAKQFSTLMAPGFSASDQNLMANLTRIVIFGEILFIIGSFLSAILQSYNHFFIPGFASALYNLGIIIGIVLLAPFVGIYSAAYGIVFGALIFVLAQIPLARKMGFSFMPSLSFEWIKTSGVVDIFKLIWPRTISIAIFQIGTIITVTLVGQAIAQAAFPVLAKEKERLEDFKTTFITSFNQLLYIVLPFSVLFLVLRIPIVRLIFGAAQFDWQATVLTGRTLAFFSISIFAQALVYLVSRGFYALHDTKTPLIIGAITTILMIIMGAVSIFVYHLGVESIAIAYSIASILNFLALFIFLDRKVGGFTKIPFVVTVAKIFLASAFTAFALYIPIKLLDQLVFDTTKTINLIFLTGISSSAGLILYLFLTWLFDVKEAKMFISLFKKIGDWRQILNKSDETIDGIRVNP